MGKDKRPYIDQYLEDPKNRLEYQRAAVFVSIGCELNTAMKAKKWSVAKLSDAADIPKKDIEALLRGEPVKNFLTVIDAFTALESGLLIKAVKFTF